MSRFGYNHHIIAGNAGRDPDIHVTPTGTTITSFSLATSERWTDKSTGEVKEVTEWHPCKAFGKLGEIASKLVKKGARVLVAGPIKSERYKDANGNEVVRRVTHVDDIQVLGALPSREEGSSRPASSTSGRQNQRSGPPVNRTAGAEPGDDFNDDLPFR